MRQDGVFCLALFCTVFFLYNPKSAVVTRSPYIAVYRRQQSSRPADVCCYKVYNARRKRIGFNMQTCTKNVSVFRAATRQSAVFSPVLDFGIYRCNVGLITYYNAKNI